MKKIIVGLLILVLTLLVAFIIFCGEDNNITSESKRVYDFNSCIAAGGDIAESYPRQCFIQDQSFVEEIGEFSEMAKEDCESKGGTYEIGGMAQVYFCNLPSKDSGKSCTSSDQCEGLCLAETKTCSEMQTTFGCTPILEDGAEVTICID